MTVTRTRRPRPARSAAAALVLTAVVVAGPAVSRPSASSAAPGALPGRPITWLAAGDSYSSGEGLPHSTGTCAQADDNGSHAWAQETRSILAASGAIASSRFDFTACTGAHTDQFWSPTRKSGAEWDGHSHYDLITFTFGGDDVGFAPFLEQCLIARSGVGYFASALSSTVKPASGIELASSQGGNACPSDSAERQTIRAFGDSYRHFLERVAMTASVQGGNILVLGYPELIEDPNLWTGLSRVAQLCQGIAPADAYEIRGLAGALNQTIGNAVNIVNNEHRNGVTLRFLDVNSGGSLGISTTDQRLFEPATGSRHTLCGSKSWMNGITSIDLLSGSFHPKQGGLDAEASMAADVLRSQMNWDETQPAAPTSAAPTQRPAAPRPTSPPVNTPAPPSTSEAPGASVASSSASASVASPPPTAIDRTAIISYNRMSGGAPFYGRATKGWQSFIAASNTLTQVGVTWSNPADTPGAIVPGADTEVSICTGVGDPASADPCQGRLADASVPVRNQGESTADLGDHAVTPGATYYVFYYQPSYQAGRWDLYWWNCPGCPATGRNNSALADQNQVVVRGYNR